MRLAVIDCGTNTFNLLIADSAPDGWSVVFQNKLPVKLGAGGFLDKQITPSRFIRGMDALYCHRHNIFNFSCEKTFALATSAIREAVNGRDFTTEAKLLLDLDIEIIDGDREAELVFKGISQTMAIPGFPVLVMDIGGGSTEFIIADSSGILWKQSFLLGVSRLHELINPSDRMKNDESAKLRSMLDNELKPLHDAIGRFPVKWLIGSSGSFDTLLDMYIEGTRQVDVVPGLSNEIPMQTFPGIHAWLMGSTFSERLKHPVIPTIRAEYMPLASYLVHYVLGITTFEKFYHSAYSLKEGAVSELMKNYAAENAPSE